MCLQRLRFILAVIYIYIYIYIYIVVPWESMPKGRQYMGEEINDICILLWLLLYVYYVCKHNSCNSRLLFIYTCIWNKSTAWRECVSSYCLGPVSISERRLSVFLVKSRSREICNYNCPIALKFDRHSGSIAADVPFNYTAIRQFKVPISWLRDFTRSYEKTSLRILRRGPGFYSTLHWSGQHGLPHLPISPSAQCSLWTSRSNIGKNSHMNTVEV